MENFILDITDSFVILTPFHSHRNLIKIQFEYDFRARYDSIFRSLIHVITVYNEQLKFTAYWNF